MRDVIVLGVQEHRLRTVANLAELAFDPVPRSRAHILQNNDGRLVFLDPV